MQQDPPAGREHGSAVAWASQAGLWEVWGAEVKQFFETALAMIGAVGLVLISMLAYLLYMVCLMAMVGIVVGGVAAIVVMTVRFVIGAF